MEYRNLNVESYPFFFGILKRFLVVFVAIGKKEIIVPPIEVTEDLIETDNKNEEYSGVRIMIGGCRYVSLARSPRVRSRKLTGCFTHNGDDHSSDLERELVTV